MPDYERTPVGGVTVHATFVRLEHIPNFMPDEWEGRLKIIVNEHKISKILLKAVKIP